MSIRRRIYNIGYAAERRAKQTLESEGYFVMTSRGSHGTFDLVGITEIDIRLIQVKVCQFGKISGFRKTRKMIELVKAPANVSKELWVWERRVGWHFFKE